MGRCSAAGRWWQGRANCPSGPRVTSRLPEQNSCSVPLLTKATGASPPSAALLCPQSWALGAGWKTSQGWALVLPLCPAPTGTDEAFLQPVPAPTCPRRKRAICIFIKYLLAGYTSCPATARPCSPTRPRQRCITPLNSCSGAGRPGAGAVGRDQAGHEAPRPGMLLPHICVGSGGGGGLLFLAQAGGAPRAGSCPNLHGGTPETSPPQDAQKKIFGVIFVLRFVSSIFVYLEVLPNV